MKLFEKFCKNKKKRLLALALAAVTAMTSVPAYQTQAADSDPAPGTITTVADAATIQRVETIYGDNTQYAGKITVGKSVSDTGYENNQLDGVDMSGVVPEPNNFLVTLGQTAQIMGLAKEMAIPIDAVFILDTSGSMTGERYVNTINAANNAISSLMAANEHNRIAVVAFSGEDDGGGTSDGAAASVLSDLAHYDGEAATAHLQRVDSQGQPDSDGVYVAGRNADTYTYRNITTNVNSFRHAVNGGTNLHAGIAVGASLLMKTTDTQVTIAEKTTTRIPFIIVLSDGLPTYSYDGNWYDINQFSNLTQKGSGYTSDESAGNGFLPALTAAYYKGAVTEHYFGTSASEENRCQIYTIGVGISSSNLAKMTLDPKTELANTRNSYLSTFNTYWNNYESGSAFNVVTDEGRWNDETVNISGDDINATKNYVTGKNDAGTRQMYSGGLAYNDAYLAAENDTIIETFDEIVRLIQIKAISLPTDTTYSTDFGGYVHFYDPIGEYMEVKKMHGIVAKDPSNPLSDSLFYQGKSFARHLLAYNDPDSQDHNPEFNEAFEQALLGRLTLSQSREATNLDIAELARNAAASDNQLIYENDGAIFDNSICWWGHEVVSNTLGDDKMQYLGWADDDSVDYITSAAGLAAKPDSATHINRSYYYYGTAGDQVGPTQDALLFAIRVQRSLTAPYQQTVYVSIPGSLLSVNRVLVTEKVNGTEAEVFVQPENPVRVVYEVGLQSDINAFNVEEKLAGSDYVKEQTSYTQLGSVHNYDLNTDTYYFYTNDWDRSGSQDGHSRAMTRAGFDISEDNDFYTYTEDRLLYTQNGQSYTPVTGTIEVGTTYYYAREYYDWSAGTGAAKTTTESGDVYLGNMSNMKKTEYVPVAFGSTESINAVVKEEDGQWYIKKGTHTSASLTSDTEVVSKGNGNNTSTSGDVAHYMKTDAVYASTHYTVYLGNNGRLALTADEAAKKSVDIDFADPNRQDVTGEAGNGQVVTVGDVLTYNMTVKNTLNGTAAEMVVTDTVPAGTKLVEKADATGSNPTDLYEITADGATVSVNIAADVTTITWKFTNIPVGESRTVGFKAEVTESALDSNIGNIENQATLTIGDNVYTTNLVSNPPIGKKVVLDGSTADIGDGVKVGDELRYTIEYTNAGTEAQAVTIVDTIPAGTTVIESSITDDGVLSADGSEITWELGNVTAPGTVSFTVVVDESAKTPVVNGATVQIGNNTYETNSTNTTVNTGNVQIVKAINNEYYNNTEDEVYTLRLTTRSTSNPDSAALTGQFTYAVDGTNQTTPLTFTNGIAELTIKNGQTVEIKNLPQGLEFRVEETHVKRGNSAAVAIAGSGYTAAYVTEVADNPNAGTISVLKNGINKITVTNTYEPSTVTYRFVGKKSLTTDPGVTVGATAFEFGLWGTNADATATLTETPLRTVTANVQSSAPTAAITFPNNSVTAAQVLGANGTHTAYYFVKELSTSPISGVTYDDTQYHVEVVTTDNGAGSLQVRYRYRTRTGDVGTWSAWSTLQSPTATANGVNDLALIKTAGDTNAITFVNKYTPEEVTLTLTATKNLTGRAMTEEEFSYTVTDANGNVVATDAQKTLASGGKTATINFTTLTFYKPGSYVYTVKELAGNRANITYDTAEYTVTVTVEQSGSKLEVTNKAYTVQRTGQSAHVAAQEIVFNNTYGTIELVGNKTLEIRDFNNAVNTSATVAMAAGEYDFIVYATDEQGVGNTVVGGGKNTAISEADGAATAAISFDKIYYSVTADELANADANGIVKTLYYRIEETKPTVGANPYMDYDDSVWYVTVPVKYDAGTGEVTTGDIAYRKGTYDNTTTATSAQFTNIEYPNSITVTPQAKKTTSGTLPSGDINFSFAVRPVEGGNAASVGSANASGQAVNVTFSPITYTTPGTYQYWILETNTGAGNGVTYDTTKYLMEVVVTLGDGQNGTLDGMLHQTTVYKALKAGGDPNAVADYTEIVQAGNVSFTNTYAATGYLNITVKKSLTGSKNEIGARQFAFRLERLNGEGGIGTGNYIYGFSGAGTGTSTVTFNTLNFSDSMFDEGVNTATLYYEMTELDQGARGYSYDPTKYELEVTLTRTAESGNITAAVTKVTNKSDSTISYTVTSSDDGHGASINITFANTYEPVTPGAITIVTTKELTGRNLVEDEFTFQLHHVVDGNEGNTSADNLKLLATTSNKNGKVSFNRAYAVTTTPGVYVYRITEVNEGKTGIIYDTDPVFAYVKIADINGTIIATLHNTKADAENGANPINTAEAALSKGFKNAFSTYTPGGITKKLTGRGLLANGYSFAILDMSDKVVSTGYNTAVQTGTTDNSAGVTFTPLHFSNPGTYQYQIKEVAGANAAITYDDTVYYLQVVVDAEGRTAATYYSDSNFEQQITGDIVFNNRYTANGSAQLEAKKVLEGRTLLENEFSFGVYTAQTGGILVTTGSNKADGTVEFGAIGFTQNNYKTSTGSDAEGYVHTYYMKEIVKADGTNGITYAKDVYQVKVTVKDNGTGYLSTTVAYYDADGNQESEPVFTNKYTPAPTDISLSADKSVQGKTLNTEKFTFLVKDASTGNPIQVEDATLGQMADLKAQNDANGIVRFAKIPVNAAGTYKYIIEEAGLDQSEGLSAFGAYTKDNAKYLAVAVVTDNGLGALSVASVTYYRWAGSVSDSEVAANQTTGAGFVNVYKAKAVTADLDVAIGATKTITGHPYTLAGGEFKFDIVDSTTTILQGVNKADGSIDFPEFTFTAAGDYYYRIRECTVDKKPGFTYDDRQWEVRISVKYDAAKGELSLDKENDVKVYDISRAMTEATPEFINEYHPTPVQITLNAAKELTGGTGRTLKNNEFTFRVLENGVILAEAKNTADGKVTFSFTESQAGAHTYDIVEVKPTAQAEGVTYDANKYSVNVTVVDDNGVLKIDGNTNHQINSTITFRNEYKGVPTPEIVTFTVNKVLHGAALTADAFEFELLDALDGNKLLQTAKNDANGAITFVMPANYFAAAGNYSYIIREKLGNTPDIDYDTSEIHITVDVTDNLAGKLVAKVNYPADVTFENTYVPPTPPVPHNDDVEYKVFKFTKKWDDNNNVKGKRPESVIFEAYQDGVYVTDITLTAEDAWAEDMWVENLVLMYSQDDYVYTWTVKEKNVPEGYTVTYNQDTLTVTNTLEGLTGVLDSPETGDAKPIGLLFGLAGVSALGIGAILFTKKRRRKEI